MEEQQIEAHKHAQINIKVKNSCFFKKQTQKKSQNKNKRKEEKILKER